jgi:hypothetical protein
MRQTKTAKRVMQNEAERRYTQSKKRRLGQHKVRMKNTYLRTWVCARTHREEICDGNASSRKLLIFMSISLDPNECRARIHK